jgi:osmotically inducible protein OsmC
MTDVQRQATGVWIGDLKQGTGRVSSESGALMNMSYSFPSRFEQGTGSNPEELIAAAHAACFSMAFANELSKKGYTPQDINTRATITLDTQALKITRIHLETQGNVADIDDAAFIQIAEVAKDNCPVSVLLKPGLEAITLNASRVQVANV